MSLYNLTLVDVRRVQNYLFNANELKQNLGASYIVEQAARDWVHEALNPLIHNWPDPGYDDFEETHKIESGTVDAEVIFAGGGNAAILFASRDKAFNFSKEYTCKVLQEAPGLDVAVGHTDVEWNNQKGMQEAWRRLQEDVMPRRKEGYTTPQPLSGLSVTAQCVFTGKPAVHEFIENERGILMSAECFAKKNHIDAAKDRLDSMLKADPFSYPSVFDELGGEPGRSQFVAVVHADGNEMSRRIKQYVGNAVNNRDAVCRMREFSAALNSSGMRAMQAVRDWMTNAPEMDEMERWVIRDSLGGNNLVRLSELETLPIRPIVFGGDDVTFVCDGHLGLALAVEFLKAFNKTKLPDEKLGYACAGVSIVHSHYPFSRAYTLAEELCREAKILTHREYESADVSLLNWHYTTSGLTLNWEDIINREHMNGKLLLRPLVVNSGPGISIPKWRTWNAFLLQISGFRQDWRRGRSKLKELQESLRKAENEVRTFTSIHGPLPVVSGLEENDAHKTGWYENQCIYFDALEINDMFIYPKEVSSA